MTDLFINVDVSSGRPQERTRGEGEAGRGNRNRRRFLRKRKFLEKLGFIKKSHRRVQKPEQRPRNPWDHSEQNGQMDSHDGTRRINNNSFHQQGAPDTSSRTATVAAPRQTGTLIVSVNCDSNWPHPAPASEARVSGAKKPAKPLIQQYDPLSEYQSGPPPPSYKIVAIDCEMVGTGPKGQNSALARCSIVSYQGDVVYDRYVKPSSPVTDYRTRWSGIRREHLVNAVPFSVARKEVLKLLCGKIVIGHAIQNDYKALGYFHPAEMTRDTSKIPLLNRKAGFTEWETASLKRLAKQVLQKDIQTGRNGHCSVEDAKTTMELYRAVEAEHERELAAGQRSSVM